MNSQQIQNIINSLGQRQAEINAYNWLTEQKDNIKSLEVVFSEGNILHPGKIHTFNYNPKYKNILDYYDRNPVVLSLGNIQRGKRILELGINLNFVPTPYKWQLLEVIRNIYSGYFTLLEKSPVQKSALHQPIIKYNYQALKSLLSNYGFSFALRAYIPSRKQNTYIINYNNWTEVALLSIEDFERITMIELLKKFKDSKK
jgi:hypothetical protein